MELSDSLDNNEYKAILSGKFMFTDNVKFRSVLEKFSNEKITQIYFCMDQVEFVDSAALGMLLLARDEAIKLNKKLVLGNINGQVKKMFELAHFEKLFSIQ